MQDIDPYWLVKHAEKLQALASAGLQYSNNPYDTERYKAIRAIAADLLADVSQKNKHEVLDILAKDYGYQTPKLDVRVAIFENNKILMVKEFADNKWALPGGWADVSESPAESAAREVFEETGFNVKITKLTALYDKRKHDHPIQFPHTIKAIFMGEMLSGEKTLSHEILAIDWFALDELPDLSIDRITEKQIARVYEHKLNNYLATDFD